MAESHLAEHRRADAAKGGHVAQTQLTPGAIGLPGVLMQVVTAIAPAIAGMFTIPFIVANASVTAPLAYLGAFIIALMLGYVLAQFGRHMTPSGSYYTLGITADMAIGNTKAKADS